MPYLDTATKDLTSSLHHKFARLDTLRWLAALSVGIGHAFLCFNFSLSTYSVSHSFWDPHFWGTLVFNGAYAVDMFFVLSGFVLINSLKQMNKYSVFGFLIRRITRIYPAAWISMVLAICAFFIWHQNNGNIHPFISGWILGLIKIQNGYSIASAINNALIFHYSINPILWTIRIEIFGSIMYPAMLFVFYRSHYLGFLLLFVLMVFSAFIGASDPFHYLFMFAAGLSLNFVRKDFFKNPAAVLLVALLLMAISRPLGQGHTFLEDLTSTISSSLAIYIIAYQCPKYLKNILENRILLTFGQSSYSYYLFNGIILFFICARVIPEINPWPIQYNESYMYFIYSICTGILAATITIPFAIISAITIEKYSIYVGRKINGFITSLQPK
jgi:peptidoglycan/LPS O-acetylase OafA/YrhL